MPIGAVTVLGAASWSTQPCRVPIVWEVGADAERFDLRIHEVPAGATEVVGPGEAERPVSPVLALGPGMSADLVRERDARLLVLRCGEEGAVVSTRSLEDGTERTLPAAPADQLDRWDLRISVRRGTGESRVFRIEGGRVSLDDGPALDLFAGQVPMEAGDVAVTLEVKAARHERGDRGGAGDAIEGVLPLGALGPFAAVAVELPGGREADFVVDLAATRTAVSARLLDPGIETFPVEATAWYGDEARTEAAGVLGAGGATAPVRMARLPWLRVGEVRFEGVEALVLPGEPVVEGRPVLGILGTDLLRRAGRVTADFSRPAESGSELRLGGRRESGWSAVPMQEVRGLLFVELRAGPHTLRGILDSGARHTLIHPERARELGWRLGESAADTVRGIDGAPIAIRSVEAPALKMDGAEVGESAVMAGPVAVLDAIGLREAALLLGQPFFAQLGRVQIDFQDRVLRVRGGGG